MAMAQEKHDPSPSSPPLPPLPVIDISTFINPLDSEDERQKTTTDMIRQACAEIGFFYVTVPGIEKAQLDRVVSRVRKFSRYMGPIVPALISRIPAIGRAAAHAMSVIYAKRDVLVRCGTTWTETDYDLVTLLLTNPAIGDLYVWSKRGQWIKANPIPGAFLVNVGDTIEHQVNGRWESTSPHIIYTGDRFRVSMPFLYKPRRALIRNPYGELEKAFNNFRIVSSARRD